MFSSNPLTKIQQLTTSRMFALRALHIKMHAQRVFLILLVAALGTLATFGAVSVANAAPNAVPVLLDTKMYVVNLSSNAISRADLNGAGGVNMGNLAGTLGAPLGIALDVANNKMYVLNNGTNTISRANLDGTGGVNLGNLSGTLNGAYAIALDLTNNKIYVTNSGTNTIIRANLDGTGGSSLGNLNSTLNGPYGIALDVANNKMYVTNGNTNTVSSANLDGTGGVSLSIPGGSLNSPRGIALDLTNNKMYVVNETGNSVTRANLDGTGGVNLGNLAGTLSTSFDIALDVPNNKMYVTNVATNAVSRANLDGTGGVSLGNLAGTLNNPRGIALMSLPVTKTDTLNDLDADNKADPGETIDYTVVIPNSGTDATGVTFTDTIDSNTTLFGAAHASPIAFDDTYNWVGNTQLDTSARGLPSVTANDVAVTDTYSLTPFTGPTSQGGTVTLASDGHFVYTPQLGDTGVADTFMYTITNDTDGTLVGTGTVTINLTGRVWYLVAGGVGDGRSNTPSGDPAAMSTAANLSTDFFYVFSNASPLNGPFTLDSGQQLLGRGVSLTVSSILLFNAGAAPTITNTGGDVVTLNSTAGTNTVSGLVVGDASSDGIFGNNFGTLTVSSTSINNTTGQALNLTGGAIAGSGFTATTSSGGTNNISLTTITGTLPLGSGALSGASGTAFNVSGGTVSVTYSGNITKNNAGSMVSVSAHSTGTITFSGTLSATTASAGDGLQFSNADGTYNFNGTTTLNGGDAGIDILAGADAVSGSTGTFSFTSGTAITRGNGVAGAAFNLSGSDANVTYSGTMTLGTTSGNMVAIDDHDAGTITFQTGDLTKGSSVTQGISISNSGGGSINFNNPTISITMTTGNAVSLTGTNAGGTINFAIAGGGNGLDISTTSGIGFNSTGGGTISVTGAGNTIISTTGAALNVANTTIGASGLTFQSIAVNGATNGIVLNNTGASGGLTVTGTGTANSGGTIQNTTSDSILLTSVSNIVLQRMLISGSDEDGIHGDNVNNFTFQDSTISGFANGSSAETEDGMDFTNLTGTVIIQRAVIGPQQGFTLAASPPVPGNKGISIRNTNVANMTMTVTGTTFTQIDDDGIDAEVFGSSQPSGSRINTLTVDGSTGDGANVFNQINGRAITYGSTADDATNGTLELTIKNNTFTTVGIGGRWAAQGGTTINARYNNNSMTGTTNDAIRSLSDPSNGPVFGATTKVFATVSGNNFGGGAAFIASRRNSTSTITFGGASAGLGNTNIGLFGINTESNRGATLNIDILNNTVVANGNAPSNAAAALYIQAADSSGGGSTTCANIRNNSFNVSPFGGAIATVALDKVTALNTLRIEGWDGSGGNPVGAENYIKANNVVLGSPQTASSSTADAGSAFDCVTSVLALNQAAPMVVAQAQVQPKTDLTVGAESVSATASAAKTLAVVTTSEKVSKQAVFVKAPSLTLASTGGDSSKQFSAALSGETVTVGPFTLPANKTVTIKFRVTVDNPIDSPVGATKILNQGTVSGSNFSSVTTSNAGPVDCETDTKTCTPIDRPDATVLSINRQTPSAALTNANTVTWRVTFNTPVAGLALINNNFALTDVTSSITGEAISSIVAVTGSPDTQWDVTVNTGTGDGTLRLDMVNDVNLSHDVFVLPGSPNPLPFTGQTYTIDKTAPTIVSFTCFNPLPPASPCSNYPTNADILTFHATFSEQVTGVAPGDFLSTGTSTAVDSITGGGGIIFGVVINGTDGTPGDLANYNGTVGLDFNPGVTIADLAGNAFVYAEPTPASNDETYTLDNSAPTVTNVTSTAADGSYTTGAVIPVTVTFNEVVTVAGGTPQLTLETGASDAVVNYTSGSGSNTLTFNYTVSAGDTSADLDYIGISALALNGSTIRDAATNNAVLTLVAPGAVGSLGNNKDIVIDTTAPTITNVTSTAGDGSYTIGAVIPVTVTFSEPVTVAGGTPQLTLETGATDAVVNYTSGSGSNTLTFDYTVSAGDTSADLDYIGISALALNGSTIKDAATNNAVLTLAAPGAVFSLGDNKDIVIDTTAPTVTNVTSAVADTTYGLGAVIPITVTFSEPVTVAGGTPQLTLAMTGTPTTEVVNYTGGSGTNTLTFTYTVQLGDITPDLDYVGTTSLALNGATIKDAATNNAVLTLAAPAAAGSLGANKNIVIDATNPVVTNVSSTKPDGSYKAGTIIDVTVTFSSVVNVNTGGGTPTLTLETGSTDAVVDYFGGTGSNTLTFRYTVGSTDNSLDLDYVSTSALALNGGTIKDGSSNDAILTLASPGASGSLGFNKAIVIDTIPPIRINNVTSSNPNGSYTTGADIYISITYSENVYVTGSPVLKLETGATDRNAVYDSGSGTITLVFKYTVQAGDTSADLDYFDANALTLPGGATMTDLAGNNAILGPLSLPGTSGSLGASKDIVIDTTAPTVTNVTSIAADGSYTIGAVIPVTVTFSEPVTVAGGTPQLTLETGATDAVVNYTSGSGSNTLTFNYTVSAGDTSADLDYISISALALNGSTIKDAATNDAVLTLAAPGAVFSLGGNKDIVIDTTAPTVTTVTSAVANTTYGVGAVIPITVTFSEPVTVAGGTPQLTLETGATDEVVNYTSGSGTTTLTFTYTVQVGDTSADLDYVGTTSLALNGATITDAATNNAILTLASPGNPGSLGNNKNIVIDGVAPTVVAVNSSTSDGNYGVGSIISVEVLFSENVTVTNTPQITLETGTTDEVVNYSSGSGGANLFFLYTVVSGDFSTDLDYVATNSLALNGGTIKDSIGNNAVLTLAAPGAANSLGANRAIVIDAVAPTVTIDNPSKPNNPTNTTVANFTFTGSDGSGVGGITYECKLNAGTFAACAPDATGPNGAQNYAGLIDGTTYTFQVRATDSLGNVGSPDSYTWKVDTTPPTAVLSTLVSSPTNTTPILVTITFSEPVTGVGAGDLSATNGLTSIPAGGPAVYTFNLSPIADGPVTVKYLALSASDLAGNQNTADSNILSITYDTTGPTVTNVSSTALNATYGTGAVIPVTVTFNEAVTVTGTPQLTLETGATDEVANYTGGSGTNTLTFTYNVLFGDITSDLDYTSTTSLALNSGTIRDAATNNATLTLPAPAAPSSLGANKDIVIDATAAPPVITSTKPANVTMSEDSSPTPFSLNLTANDPNGDTITWSILSQGTYGTASASGTGTSKAISYTPLPNYNGSDSFVVKVTDGISGFDTITVNVTIQPVGDSPDLIWNQSYSIKYDTWFGTQDVNALTFASGYRKATSGTFTFKPGYHFTAFTWVTYRGPDQGKAQVLVDGVVKATVDLYHATAQWQYPIVISGLTYVPHTVVIKPLNTKNPASSNKWVVVDGFKIGSTTYDDDVINVKPSGLFSYGSWVGLVQKPGPRFGAYRLSTVKNATASFAFDGTQLSFVTARGPSYGKVAIYVDGVLKKTVDLYKASQQWQYKVDVLGLTYGHHTVVIKVTGLKNSHSSGIGVVCDGFEIE